jgi:hypothetical protein
MVEKDSFDTFVDTLHNQLVSVLPRSGISLEAENIETIQSAIQGTVDTIDQAMLARYQHLIPDGLELTADALRHAFLAAGQKIEQDISGKTNDILKK